MQALDRLLQLVCRELEAERAWIEYGSEPPPNAVSAPVRDGWRLCATLPDPSDTARGRLEELAASFDRVLLEAAAAAPTPATGPDPATPLREALDVLVDRTAAEAAWVIDERSPVVWGASSGADWLTNIERAREIGRALGDASTEQVVHWVGGQQVPPPPAALQPHLPALAHALEDQRADRLLTLWAAVGRASDEPRPWSWQRDPLHVLVRPFAAIYRLMVLFEGPFSPLHAETTIGRALPVIERLVADHPPIDPTPKGARVHAFVRPER